MMPEKLTEFDAAEYINTDERARLYLEVAADEDPGDGSLIRAALNDIARAQNMSRLARDAKLDRAGLYKALSEDGNPSFSTVMKITRALGLNPNPPKDTDGRREDRGRGVRELQGGWPGLHWGRWEISGRSSAAAQGPLWPPARAGMRGMAREYAAGNSRGPG